MSKTLKVVLPVTLDGDSAYTITDDEDLTSATSSARYVHDNGNIVHVKDNRSKNRQSLKGLATKFSGVTTGTRHDKVYRYRRNYQEKPPNQHKQPRPCEQHDGHPQQHVRNVMRQRQTSKSLIPPTLHHIPDDNLIHGNFVLFEKRTRTPSSSAVPRKMEPLNNWQYKQRSTRDVQLSVTDSYDIDLEHADIMMKALKSYSQHYTCDGDDRGNDSGCDKDHIRKTSDHITHNKRLSVFSAITPRNRRTHYSDEYEELGERINTSRVMKMSQCRLKFYDDNIDKETQINKTKQSNISPLAHNSPLLYPLENADGILADATGHVYRSKQTRSWSARPGKLFDLIKVDRESLCPGGNRRLQDSVGAKSCNQNKTTPRISNNTSSQSKVQTPSFGRNMSQPIPHSLAYQRRNQTTHMWTDSSQLMSQSMPGSSFLQRNFGSSFSSPRSSRDDSSDTTTPAGKATRARPSSSYSYDGGFFVGAHSGQAEYFVIHPDWVSETVRVKKLPINDKKTGSSLQRSASVSARTLLDGRRCLSAPPKQRNPITMDHNEPSDKTSN